MLRRKETRVRQFLTLLMFSLTACLLLLLLLFLCRHQASHPYPQQVTFTTCTIVAFCKLRDFVANGLNVFATISYVYLWPLDPGL